MSEVKEPIDIDAVSGRELDALVAEWVMRWAIQPVGAKEYPVIIREYPSFVFYSFDSTEGWHYRSEHALEEKWSPSQKRDHAAQVEVEIERRGLQGEYVEHLIDKVFPDGLYWRKEIDYKGAIFPLITATPAQRCRAALRAVQGEMNE